MTYFETLKTISLPQFRLRVLEEEQRGQTTYITIGKNQFQFILLQMLTRTVHYHSLINSTSFVRSLIALVSRILQCFSNLLIQKEVDLKRLKIVLYMSVLT